MFILLFKRYLLENLELYVTAIIFLLKWAVLEKCICPLKDVEKNVHINPKYPKLEPTQTSKSLISILRYNSYKEYENKHCMENMDKYHRHNGE